MAKTSVLTDKTREPEAYPADGGGTVILVCAETGKEDQTYYLPTVREAEALKLSWDD